MKVINVEFSTGNLKKDQEKALEFLKTLPGFVSAVFNRDGLFIYKGGERFNRIFVCVFDPTKTTPKALMNTQYEGKYCFSWVKTELGAIGER